MAERELSLYDRIVRGVSSGLRGAVKNSVLGSAAQSFTPPPQMPSPPPAAPVDVDRSAMGPSTIGNVPSFAEAMQRGIAEKLGGGVMPPMRGPSTPPVVTPKPSMRAIRLPNGTVLFTNRDEYGGDEFTGGTAAAGREIRARDAAMPRLPSSAVPNSGATGDLPGALVRASQDQARRMGEMGPAAPEPTHHVAGRAFDARPGVSFIEGTPQQQREISLQDMQDAIALERGGQELEVAKLPPGEAAALSNPTVQSGNWLIQNVGPELDKTVAVGQAKIRMLSTPGAPGYIADPKMRQQEIQRVEEETRAKRQNLIDLMSAITRQAIQPY